MLLMVIVNFAVDGWGEMRSIHLLVFVLKLNIDEVNNIRSGLFVVYKCLTTTAVDCCVCVCYVQGGAAKCTPRGIHFLFLILTWILGGTL